MLFLYFEDATQFVSILNSKGIKNGGRIIKVFTSPFDPRVRLEKPSLKVIETDDSSLQDMTFEYKHRGTYLGSDIEQEIAHLRPYPQRSVRALFRFSNRKELQFCQTGMGMKVRGGWLISHPLQEIDGISQSINSPDSRSATIHLDIFNRGSLWRLRHILNFSKDSGELVDFLREGPLLRKEIQFELNKGGRERI
jgi:hypothetical protein